MSKTIRKIFKLCLSIIGVAVVFVVAIAGVFITTFDANNYKKDLSEMVLENTGRDLQFYGDVGLTFYPTLGMELGALSLSNATGFDSAPMVKVNKVSISVDVASVIAFSPKINELILDGLKINLQKNTEGVTNWDDLTKTDTTQSSNSESEASIDNPTRKPMQISGAFGGLNITNAQLSWVDVQAGEDYQVQNLAIKTGQITPGAPFDLQVQVTLESKGEIKADIDFVTQIQYWFDKEQLDLSDLAMSISAVGESLPSGKIQVAIASDLIELNPQKRSASLKGFALTLDDNEIIGDMTVSNNEQLVFNFKLATDNLDIDALLGTPPTQPISATTEKETEASQDDVQINLPMNLLRTIQIDGELVVKQLKMQNLLMRDIDLGISANAGVIDIDPIKMNLYGGSFSGQVRLDVRNKLPKYRVTKEFQGVKIGKLLTDFNGEDRMSGLLNANVSLTTQGEWLSALKKNSNGNMMLAFKDGALKGFNIRQSIDQAKAKIKGESGPQAQDKKTNFSSLELSGLIKKGIFISNDLNLQAPVMRVGGEGQVDLNKNTVNYLVNVKLVGTIKGQEGGTADELSGLLIPVRIDGPFSEPKIDVQLDEMLKNKAAALKAKMKAKLDEQKAVIAEQKAELQKKISEEKVKLKKIKDFEFENKKKILESKLKAKVEQEKKKLLNKLFN